MTQLSFIHGASPMPSIGATIGLHFDRIAEQFGDRDALIVRHQQVRWTYRELKERVDAFVAGLVALGRERGFGRGFACLGLCLVALLGCTAETSTSAPIPALAPGIARVWFLRAWDAPSGQGSVYAAAPVIFANGAPIGDIRTGTEFFRDFPPGTYRFTVQPFGLPTSQETTVELAGGTQTYIQVQWAASWQFGYPEAGWSFAPNTFVITPMSARVAQAYLPTLTNLGQR